MRVLRGPDPSSVLIDRGAADHLKSAARTVPAGHAVISVAVGGTRRDLWQITADAADALVSEVCEAAGIALPDVAAHPRTGLLPAQQLRVTLRPTEAGIDLLVHKLPPAPKLADLGYGPAVASTLRAALANPDGLVLLAGPTGAGKTTTAYAMLGALAADGMVVCSAEDPVEILIPNVCQQDSTHGGLAGAFTSCLRQAPDVVAVSEIRDAALADLALRAAEQGPVVLAGTHAPTCEATLSHLTSMGVDPSRFAAVGLILAQYLVPALCRSCSTSRAAAPREAATHRASGAAGTLTTVSERGPGCSSCSSGVAGLVPIVEVAVFDHDLRARFAAQQRLEDVVAAAMRHTFASSAWEQVAAGALSPTDAARLPARP